MGKKCAKCHTNGWMEAVGRTDTQKWKVRHPRACNLYLVVCVVKVLINLCSTVKPAYGDSRNKAQPSLGSPATYSWPFVSPRWSMPNRGAPLSEALYWVLAFPWSGKGPFINLWLFLGSLGLGKIYCQDVKQGTWSVCGKSWNVTSSETGRLLSLCDGWEGFYFTALGLQ